MLLKNIPGMLPVLENSDLSLTKLWHKPIERIVPEQLTAIILKNLNQNPESKIELEVKFAVKQIKDAVTQGIIPTTRLASFSTPRKEVIVMSNFIRGLHSLSFAKRRAVLFSLEAKLPFSQVENMTNQQAYRLVPNMSQVAKEIIDSNVISIHAGWAFWEKYDGKHEKLSNLEQHVYEAFGMTSYQLHKRYANIVIDDYMGMSI
jgi:hypothetical protein